MKWKEDEIKYLQQSYATHISIKEIMFKLNKSRKAINQKAARLGLIRDNHIDIKKENKRLLYDKEYYRKNKDLIYTKKVLRLRKYKSEFISLLGGKCSNCGYNKCPAALEFHHKSNNKEFDVKTMIKDYSKEKALKEAMKCNLLCANCHRELHYKGSIV